MSANACRRMKMRRDCGAKRWGPSDIVGLWSVRARGGYVPLDKGQCDFWGRMRLTAFINNLMISSHK